MDGGRTGLLELVEHNGWANQHLISLAQTLPVETITTAIPGVFGSVLETLQHIINSEGSYTRRLTGVWPDHPWKDDWDVDLPTLAARSATINDVLRTFLQTDWDPDAIGETPGDGRTFEVHRSVYLSQLIHHGNEHRAHVCSVLGSLGVEAPEVSIWEFALATGRMWQTS